MFKKMCHSDDVFWEFRAKYVAKAKSKHRVFSLQKMFGFPVIVFIIKLCAAVNIFQTLF